jgi:hypothetical protein
MKSNATKTFRKTNDSTATSQLNKIISNSPGLKGARSVYIGRHGLEGVDEGLGGRAKVLRLSMLLSFES